VNALSTLLTAIATLIPYSFSMSVTRSVLLGGPRGSPRCALPWIYMSDCGNPTIVIGKSPIAFRSSRHSPEDSSCRRVACPIVMHGTAVPTAR
jgi:hypothetical protein